MHAYTLDRIQQVADEEIGAVTRDEWLIDVNRMGHVVGGVIADKLQRGGVRLRHDPDEILIEAYVRCAVCDAMARYAQLPPSDSVLCSDPTLRYLAEPPFNSPESVLCN